MKKIILLFLFLLFAFPISVMAQEETLDVDFTRDWGYGGFAGEIQGKFSLRVTGPEQLVEVRFMMDETVMAVITEAPFNFQFDTDAYPSGQHSLTVIGILSDGTQLLGPEYKRTFLSAEEARSATMGLIMPLLVGVGGISILAVVVPLLFSGKGQFKVGKYGFAGGAVCSRCLLPFSRSMLAPNMLFGKLERCPHCGKWAIVRAATSYELSEAEKRYSEEHTLVVSDTESKTEQWKKSLDDTRYE